ncbi:MAG: AraC family transcriptional regulator [Verrucomicrobiae bacterium]|nr:AraC family transcriptional regulator [Verrucomicrobiae bacterium]
MIHLLEGSKTSSVENPTARAPLCRKTPPNIRKMKKHLSIFSAERRTGRLHETRIVPIFRGLNSIEVKRVCGYCRHQHPDYEVILVDRGVYRCTLNNQEIRLSPGDMLVVKPGDWHQDFLRPPLRYAGLSFVLDQQSLGKLIPPLFAENASPRQQCMRKSRTVFRPILKRLQEEHRIGDPPACQIQDALMNEFFWLLVRHLPRAATHPELRDIQAEHGFATRLMRLFQSRINDRFSLTAMSRAMNMSSSALSHRCKAILRMSPARIFMKYKMERAHTLLRLTRMSIKEISCFLGFKDPYHFSKAFKRHQGMPPSNFRQRHPLKTL